MVYMFECGFLSDQDGCNLSRIHVGLLTDEHQVTMLKLGTHGITLAPEREVSLDVIRNLGIAFDVLLG